ncbi:MAG: DNA polymerase IV [Oscillospiraceae bacterium]|nr:DNA polymerase IV [Oscillospiraceae bacterium]
MKERYILHCDCNGFFASVELLKYPELRHKPVAVGGDSETRHGIVLAKNEAAKKYGVKTAETLWQARKKCPDLIVLPPHHSEYTRYSKIVNGIYTQYTDLVEPFGIDESWLDVTNTYKLFADTPKQLADDLRKRIKYETGLTISVGVSFNKIFAKLGSDYKKPDATTVIDIENYKDIVYPLPVGDLLYVGKSTQTALAEMGIHNIGQLAEVPLEILERKFGKHGVQLYEYANGLENSPVESYYTEKDVKSVGSGNTFSRNLTGLAEIKPALLGLCEDVGMRLRRHNMYANGVQLTIRNPEFFTFSRQMQVPSTDVTEDIYKAAVDLFVKNYSLTKPVRALTVTAIDLEKEKRVAQLSLFETGSVEKRDKKEKLQATIDRIRGKYGNSAVQSATIMTNPLKKDKKQNPFGDKPDRMKGWDVEK